MNDLLITVALLYGSPLLLACGLIQFGLWLTDRAQRAYLYWASVNWLGASGLALYLVRGTLPGWFSLLVTNIIIIATGLLLWAGLRRFGGQPVHGRRFAAALCAYAVAFLAVALSFEGMVPRIVLVSLVLTVMNFGMARDLWSQQRIQHLQVRNLLIVTMLLHGGYYLYRAAYVLTVDASSDVLHTVATVDTVVAIGMIKNTIWNLATVLMVREARGALGFGAPIRTRNPGA